MTELHLKSCSAFLSLFCETIAYLLSKMNFLGFVVKGAFKDIKTNQNDKLITDYSHTAVMARIFAIKVRFQIISNYKNFKYLLNIKGKMLYQIKNFFVVFSEIRTPP